MMSARGALFLRRLMLWWDGGGRWGEGGWGTRIVDGGAVEMGDCGAGEGESAYYRFLSQA